MPEQRFAPASVEQVRAMIHPIRMRILDALRQEGPSTASRLGALLGESSGATSYHLRVLAEAGLIEEDVERGTARERWWRRTRPLYIPTGAEDPEERAVEMSARLLHLERDEAALQQFLLRYDALSSAWRGAATTGSFTVYMTPEELFEFGLTWLEHVDTYRREPHERPPGALPVQISLRAVPHAEAAEAAEAAAGAGGRRVRARRNDDLE
ncbi:MAG TPA: helix-turn-helix domain-containing protein [Gaiellaceae bacterium]|nr:helix-turn-helix domain-containing protein [Gaiellaceae bacterium]